MIIRSNSQKILLVILLWTIGFHAVTQEIYIGEYEKISVLDLNTCEYQDIPIGPLEGAQENILFDLAFHPNGKLYITTTKDIVEIDPRTWKPKILQSWTLNPQAQYMSMAINEDGDFIVGGVHGHVYDWRNNRFESHYRTEGVLINPFGFFNGRLLDLNTNRQVFSTSTLDNILAPRDTFWNFTGSEHEYYWLTKTHKPCGGTIFISQAYKKGGTLDHYLKFDESARTIEPLCYTPDGLPLRSRGLAATDDFRDNGLLLDLDADNSSYHRTGGYFDTLTICDPAGRLTDDDIDFRLCGGSIDSIVFDLKYFSDPSLEREELVTTEGGLEPAGPGKWIWHNHDMDMDRVADFLRSIRYEADWAEEESHERIVVTTAWIDGESTSSWTVYQLIGTGELAGRDSTAYYCGSTDLINLTHYLNSGVNSYDGSFVPRPSGGRTLFLPGEDPDGDYLFIVDKYGCPDTAVITVQRVNGEKQQDTVLQYCDGGDPILLTDVFPGIMGRTKPEFTGGGLEFDPVADQPGPYLYIMGDDSCPDTIEVLFEAIELLPVEIPRVRLCRGGSRRIGVPAGEYDKVEWWNGETGDSTIIYADEIRDSAWVRVTSGTCTSLTRIEVQTLLGEISFPPWVSDTVHLCHPDESFRLRTGMDSLVIDGTERYFPDDDIAMDEGLHVLAGFHNSCSAEKEIWVDVAEDLGVKLSQEYVWCPGDKLNLMLPADSAGLQFSWSDGTSGRIREVIESGNYTFEILGLSCTYEGTYEVIPDDDCKECTVSIPNAVSPNGDGINDRLEVFSDCSIRVIEIRIFDKWGGELYSAQGGEVEAQIWEDLPPGIVMVQVRYETGQGKIETIWGSVLVVK